MLWRPATVEERKRTNRMAKDKLQRCGGSIERYSGRRYTEGASCANCHRVNQTTIPFMLGQETTARPKRNEGKRAGDDVGEKRRKLAFTILKSRGNKKYGTYEIKRQLGETNRASS